MIPRHFIERAESIVAEAVHKSFPEDWEEDFVTRLLLRKLRSDLKVTSVVSRGRSFRVHWSIYKNKGKQEEMFGDIGLLVRSAFKDGRTIEGVAYLEAKKRFKSRNTFAEIRIPQLKRILKHAPRAALLLYDYDHITDFPAIDACAPWFEVFWEERPAYRHVPVTYAVTVPVSTALALGVKDTRLYTASNPFSQQLLLRYIHGLDLEFSQACITAAKGFAEKLGAPNYLLLVDLVEEGAERKAEPGLDQATWTPISDSED